MIGYLGGADTSFVDAFRQTLGELGWIEGRTISVEYRWTQGRGQQAVVQAAEELVRSTPDLIATVGRPFTTILRQRTSTIPIVFCAHSDPVGSGDVVSLARPGRNVTGISPVDAELVVKQIELLTQVVPGARRIAVLRDSALMPFDATLDRVEATARTLGLELARRDSRNT